MTWLKFVLSIVCIVFVVNCASTVEKPTNCPLPPKLITAQSRSEYAVPLGYKTIKTDPFWLSVPVEWKPVGKLTSDNISVFKDSADSLVISAAVVPVNDSLDNFVSQVLTELVVNQQFEPKKSTVLVIDEHMVIKLILSKSDKTIIGYFTVTHKQGVMISCLGDSDTLKITAGVCERLVSHWQFKDSHVN